MTTKQRSKPFSLIAIVNSLISVGTSCSVKVSKRFKRFKLNQERNSGLISTKSTVCTLQKLSNTILQTTRKLYSRNSTNTTTNLTNFFFGKSSRMLRLIKLPIRVFESITKNFIDYFDLLLYTSSH